jgi:glycosyltransferase involved in cell wall biosynthesis
MLRDTAVMQSACSIFFFEGYLGVSPTVLNLSQALDRDGYAVTVYATRNPYPTPRETGSHTVVRYLRRLADVRGGRRLERELGRVRSGSLVSLTELVLYAAECAVVRPARSRGRPSASRLSIGIDTNGVIAAWLRRAFSRAPYAYLSLEIGPWPPFAAVARIVRLLERRAYRNAEVVMVQDADRFEALTSYMRYRHPNVTFLPNAPLISGSASGGVASENFLRQRCRIAEDAFPNILLQAGIIDENVFSEELARAFAAVAGGCALVLHERLKRDPAEPYLARLRQINDVNLFLSLDPLPMEDLDRVYASATIGVAFYKASDANHSLISTASGKLGYYLKHGKPLLVHGSPSLARFVEDREIGVVVDDPTSAAEIRHAIDRMLADYARYSANARACYEAEFDFERTARLALTALHDMCPPDGSSRDGRSVEPEPDVEP